MSASLFTNFATTIGVQDAQINKLEQQIATGYAVQSAVQNPGAFEVATIATDQVSALANNLSTQSSIQTQLDSVSNTYSSVSTLYNNVQSIIEQSLNGATNAPDLQTLSTQITSASQQLLGLGNATAPAGTYLFGGSRNTVAPFQVNAVGKVVYLGDAGQSQAAVSPSTTSSTLANGEVFTSALAGNGYSTITANASNTGSATLLSEGVLQPAAASAFQTSDPTTSAITLSFATGNGSAIGYTATQGNSVIASGTTTAGSTIELAGQSFQLNSTPATGDSFTISPSRPQTAFDLLQSLAATLASTSASPAAKALTTQALNGDLSTLAQYQQTLLTAQAQNGVTLQALASSSNSDSNQQTALAATVQNATATNMPTALTTLNETITAVQAAEKAFSAVQSLSLFQYI
ncbi:MAG: flagellar hook-associated protein FlgL [Proteobacteria bacterium]|nr:flagellar hook-associated protein FlgL [Pseudomonadota bacterium]